MHTSLATMRSGPWDLIWLLILSVLCTNLTFYLSNVSLNHLSAFTANLIYNLEPVYGIVLGGVIFHENQQLSITFYIGTVIILLAIFLGPIVDFLRTSSYFADSTWLKLLAKETNNVDDDDDGMVEIMKITASETESNKSGRGGYGLINSDEIECDSVLCVPDSSNSL